MGLDLQPWRGVDLDPPDQQFREGSVEMAERQTVSMHGLGNGVKALVERVFDESGLSVHRGPWAIEAESEVDVVDGEVFIGLRITRRPDLAKAAFSRPAETN